MILLLLFAMALATPFAVALWDSLYGRQPDPEHELQTIARALASEYERRKAEGAGEEELKMLRLAKMRYLQLLNEEH